MYMEVLLLTYDLQHDLPVARGRPLEVDPAAVRAGVPLRHAQQRQHRRRLRLGVQLRAVGVSLDGGCWGAYLNDIRKMFELFTTSLVSVCH